MNITTDPGVWVAAILTIAIFSFLFKDNPLYKITENIFVGSSAGYWVVITYQNFIVPEVFDKFKMASEEPKHLILIIPVILGILMLSKLSRQHSWLSRYPIAFTVGIGAGMGITSVIKSDVIQQITTVGLKMPLYAVVNGNVNWLISLFNLVYFVAVLSALLYFFFSAEHKGFVGKSARLGIWFLMIGFGASFGFTVMARISLLIQRVSFLIHDFLGIAG